MIEPYEVLLSPLRGVWWLAPHLEGDRPAWDRILTDPYWSSLSTGEAALLNIARAIDAGDRTATVADLLYALDRDNRDRAIYALILHCEVMNAY